MSSGTRLRDAGKRQPASLSNSRRGLVSNSLGVHTSDLGEKRLNLQQVHALEHMFQGHPAVQAARCVLSGQLLSGGISLRKAGEDVELQSAFKEHLNEVWIPFAQDVIDSFLKWGLCVITYEEHENDLRRSALVAKRRKVVQSPAAASVKGRGSKAAAKAVAVDPVEPTLIVPMVPVLGSYEVAYHMGGRAGYVREYLCYSCAPGDGTREDEEARVVVRQHPDSVGNVNSPLASVFELGSFVAALTELAVTAEASRARPRMVTQMRRKDTAALDPGNLFFDSESRAVQMGVRHADSHQKDTLVPCFALVDLRWCAFLRVVRFCVFVMSGQTQRRVPRKRGRCSCRRLCATRSTGCRLVTWTTTTCAPLADRRARSRTRRPRWLLLCSPCPRTKRSRPPSSRPSRAATWRH